MEACQWREVAGRMWEKVQGIRRINGRHKIDRGNGEAKELICTTHGHELRWGNDSGRESAGWRGIKVGKMGNL